MGYNIALFFLILISGLLIFQGCAAFMPDNPEDIKRMERLNERIGKLYEDVSTGAIPISGALAQIEAIKIEVQGLQERGYSVWQLLLGGISVLLAGIFGFSRSNSFNFLTRLLGLRTQVRETVMEPPA